MKIVIFQKKKYFILKISFPKNMIEERIIKAIFMLIIVLPRMKLKGIAEIRKFKEPILWLFLLINENINN